MRRVIIESPLAGDVARNRRYLTACLRDSLLRGEAPFASHAIYVGPLDDDIREERDRGIAAGFAWRSAAHATVVYEDLGISRGMQLGIEAAEAMGHPIEMRKLAPNWAYCEEGLAADLTSSCGWNGEIGQCEPIYNGVIKCPNCGSTAIREVYEP